MRASNASVLVNSFLHGMAVGIRLRQSNVLIATAVIALDTLDDRNRWIQIKPYTLYGYPVQQTIIQMTEIESVIPFTVHYDDPVYVKLRMLRAKIFNIE
ncbi:MAG TPA: hypothetical protein VD816_03625 [Ohtaekwangia sp.]|nr:hypothetical protein [Ohtaekwangia sp.]